MGKKAKENAEMKTLILNGSSKVDGDVAVRLGAFIENLDGEELKAIYE
jgi:hypothetical protein